MNLADYIQTGCANGTGNEALAIALKCTKREARRIVNRACCSGMPICSDEHGYYFPATLEEAKRCEHIRLARAATSRRATADFGRISTPLRLLQAVSSRYLIFSKKKKPPTLPQTSVTE